MSLEDSGGDRHGRARGRLDVRVFLVVWAFTQSAFGLDEASRRMVRDLSNEGVAAYQAGNYDKALERLEEAYSMLKTAPLAYWSAKALEKLGNLVEASERYRAAERASIDPDGDPVPQRQAQTDAREAREALEPRIPKLLIRLAGAPAEGARVQMDGHQVPSSLIGHPISANPGTRSVSATCGRREVKRSIDLAEGESAAVTLECPVIGGTTPSDPAPASARAAHPKDSHEGGAGWQPLAGWLSVGVGAAGLGLGAVTAVMVYDKRAAYGCTSAGCPPELSDEQRSEGEALRTTSTIGFVAGGLLVATGVTLLVTSPKKRESAINLSPVVGLGTLGVKGSF